MSLREDGSSHHSLPLDHHVKVEAGFAAGFVTAVLPVIVKASVGTQQIELAVVRSGERVVCELVVTPVADLYVWAVIHVGLLCAGQGDGVHARQGASAGAKASVVVLRAVMPIEDDGLAEQYRLVAVRVGAL